MSVVIPNNWDKVTIEGYVAYKKSLGKSTKGMDTDSILDLQISRVCYLTNCEPEDAEACTTFDYAKMARLEHIPMPMQLMWYFKLCGIRYKLLWRAKDRDGKRLKAIEDIDARQMDGGEYCAEMNSLKIGKLDGLHQVMFNLCKPMKFGLRKKFPFIGWKEYDFKPNEVEDRIRDFKQLPMEVAYPASVFFCRVSKELTDLLDDSSIVKMKKMRNQMEESLLDLQRNTDG